MKIIMSVVAIVMCVTIAHAEEMPNADAQSAKKETVKECQIRLKDLLKCYISNATFHLTVCRYQVELALLSGTGDLFCIHTAQQEIKPWYAAANKALTKNRNAHTLLKDLHAYWLSSITGLIPERDETKHSYRIRVDERVRGFYERANRIMLEM